MRMEIEGRDARQQPMAIARRHCLDRAGRAIRLNGRAQAKAVSTGTPSPASSARAKPPKPWRGGIALSPMVGDIRRSASRQRLARKVGQIANVVMRADEDQVARLVEEAAHCVDLGRGGRLPVRKESKADHDDRVRLADQGFVERPDRARRPARARPASLAGRSAFRSVPRTLRNWASGHDRESRAIPWSICAGSASGSLAWIEEAAQLEQGRESDRRSRPAARSSRPAGSTRNRAGCAARAAPSLTAPPGSSPAPNCRRRAALCGRNRRAR